MGSVDARRALGVQITQISLLLGICLVVPISVVTAGEKRTLKFHPSDCTPDKLNEVFSLPEAHIKPDPVEIPGNVTAWGYIRVNKPIKGNISLELKLQRYLGFFWLSVPCIKHIGSCTYPDVCEFLNDHYNETIGCNEALQAHDIPCICPFLPGTYTLKPEMFHIPKLKGLWASLAKGDYKADVRLRDTDTDDVIACQHIEFSLTSGFVPTSSPTEKPKCKNFFDCLIG